MFNVSQNPFQLGAQIPADAEVIFVADFFAEDLCGGAELTTEALLKASPFRVFKLHSHEVTMKALEAGVDRFWIFGNFSRMNLQLIPSIVANLQYSILEYDYKYCKYRSPEKHTESEGRPCDCNQQIHGKMVSAFFHGAKSLWWMSEAQQQKYHTCFPFLADRQNEVLSSVFDDETFVKIKMLREKYKDAERKGWIVLGSQSWVKGFEAAEKYCKDNGLEYEIISDKPYDYVLERMAQAEGHVYLPAGADTCPRMVIEAKLLGCKLKLNENVQHAKEEWFDTDDTLLTESYLYAAREKFWNGIKDDMQYSPTLSGYTTTKDCVAQCYPFEACIQSMLGFCDEVVVVDGGSTDGTWERLEKWIEHEPKLKIKQIKRDWNAKRFALFDGQQKAKARELCTGDFCWQQDSDEIVHERDYAKIRNLIKNFPGQGVILALPVIEYWGGPSKVRCDVNPWKWRLSKNVHEITHGVPVDQRRETLDSDGNVVDFWSAGSDGCDMIDKQSGQPIPFMTFYTADVHQARIAAQQDDNALRAYEQWFRNVTNGLPSVHHFSWWSMGRKIRTYKDYWQKHWNSLFNKQIDDTPENNMFFDKAWTDVTEEEIDEMAVKLAKEQGGWIFHTRVDFAKPTKHITLDVGLPDVIKEWAEKNQ